MSGKHNFLELDVTVTLTGEEWFAMCAHLVSRIGEGDEYKDAACKLLSQVLIANMSAASATFLNEGGES